MKQDSGSKLVLSNGSTAYIKGLYENQNVPSKWHDGGTHIVLEGDNAVASFTAGTIQWNENDDKYMPLFTTSGNNSYIILDCNTIYKSNDTSNNVGFNEYTFTGNVLSNTVAKDKGYSVPTNNCNDHGFNSKPNQTDPEIPSGPKLDLISEVEYPDHEHDISATCVQPYNDKVYLSYHQRGPAQAGCLEVLQTTNSKTTLLQYLQDTEKSIDFNHIMIDSQANRLYAVGNHAKKAGILTYIGLTNDGLMDTNAKEITNGDGTTSQIQPLQTLALDKSGNASGTDENCIVRDGDRLVVMTTRGYQTYDANTLAPIETVNKNGKAKHVALNNGKLAALSLNYQDADENAGIDATVEEFNAGSSLTSPTNSYAVGIIQPQNGKNVIAIDGNNTYVCLGANGFACYTNGVKAWEYKSKELANGKARGYCNGCAFDNKYIYLAYGAYGLVVLDKNTHAEIAHMRGTEHYSANYVALDNGYIYVAYGRSRLQVFKLIED